MKNYDLLMRIIDFGKPTKKGQFMNKAIFYKNVMECPEHKRELDNGGLLGLFTHAGRYSEELNEHISYKDNIAKNPLFCNTTISLIPDGNSILAGMNLVKSDKEGYKTVKSLFDNNYPVGVSMSTLCKPLLNGNEYEINKLLGVDFTLDPAFTGTGLVEKNFSNSMRPNVDYVHFSEFDWDSENKIYNFSATIVENKFIRPNIWNIPFDKNGREQIKDISSKELFAFSNNYFKSSFNPDNLQITTLGMKFNEFVDLASNKPQHFSLLRQLIKEASFPPHRQLQRRIEELTNDVRGKSSEYVEANKQVYLDYINTPIYNWISKAFNSDSKIMLTVGLRLNRFVREPQAIQAADRKLEYIKKKRKAMNGIFDKESQKVVNNVLKDLFDRIWKYIEEKSNTTFTSNETVGTMMKAFSDTIVKFKTVDEWLSAGSDGQKDYKVWVDSFPYNASDIKEFQKSKEFYGDEKLDKLIYSLMEKTISQKDKDLLIETMKKIAVNFDDSSTIKDNTPLTEDEEKEALASRTLTDNDIDALAEKLSSDDGTLITKLMEKLEEKGTFNNGDEGQAGEENPEGGEGEMPPMEGDGNGDNPPADNQGGEQPQDGGDNPPPADNPPADNGAENNNDIISNEGNGEAQPPQDQVPPPVVNDSKYPKPKVISKQEAARLTNMNFSDMVNYYDIVNRMPLDMKRKIVSFSVVDSFNLDGVNKEDLKALYFSVGKNNNLSTETFDDIILINTMFSEGLITEDESTSLKQQLLIQELNA